MSQKDDKVKTEITEDDIDNLYKKIDKKHLNKSREDIKNEIISYSTDKEISIRNVVNSILAYEKGEMQSTQTNTEIVLVYSFLVAIVTITITTLAAINIGDADKVGYGVIAVIPFAVGAILLIGLSLFKTRRSFKRGFLINVLENWSYEEIKEDLAKETEKKVLQQIDEDKFIEYIVKVKRIKSNQPSND